MPKTKFVLVEITEDFDYLSPHAPGQILEAFAKGSPAVKLWDGIALASYRESVKPLEINWGIQDDGKHITIYAVKTGEEGR